MPSAPTYAQGPQIQEFFRWLNAEIDKRSVSKSRLAAALEYDSIQHVNKILRGKLPMPATLYKLCRAAEIPWLAAFANAGYYRYIIWALECLARLAKARMLNDKASPTTDSFRAVGVLTIDGTPYWQTPNYQEHYHIGEYIEHSEAIDDGADSNGLHKYFGSMPRQAVPYAVPKELAAAIIIAINAFPRRGDIWKPQVCTYAINLLDAITPLLIFPKDPTPQAPLLILADEALAKRNVPLDTRRVIAAEYMVAWADSECMGYTHYARLASFDQFGLAGCSSDHISPEAYMPAIRIASLPAVTEFTSLSAQSK